MPKMASETSTVTTARPHDAKTPRLRVENDINATNPADIKPIETDEDDHFFWTYTEEPHRTRRLAIIKAHPEVPIQSVNSFSAIVNLARLPSSAVLSH